MPRCIHSCNYVCHAANYNYGALPSQQRVSILHAVLFMGVHTWVERGTFPLLLEEEGTPCVLSPTFLG